MDSYHGSCLCGSVSYRIEGEESTFYHCHCQRCRKLSGAGHGSNIRVKNPRIQWLQGESLIRSYKVPEAARFRNDFCANCGAPVPRHVPSLAMAVIPAGSLDHEPPIKPQARIFWKSRAQWSCRDELPVFEEYVETDD